MLDIENPEESLSDLRKKFLILHDRFLALAIDYKFYINPEITDSEIYKLRDNVIFRLQSAKFHYELLLNHHFFIEQNIKELCKNKSPMISGNVNLQIYQMQSTEEIYSLFDSLVYHLCSNFDYLFRLINFVHGNTQLAQPKWNLFKSDKNIKNNLYCSTELINALNKLDENFVYPLIKHRSYLIHNEYAIGGIQIVLNNLQTRFLVTDVLKSHFPELTTKYGTTEMSINFAAKWLIDTTFETINEILFEIRDDIKRNRKEVMPLFFSLGLNNTMESSSVNYWGERNEI